MFKYLFSGYLLLLYANLSAQPKTARVVLSPDQKIKVSVWQDRSDHVVYNVQYNNQEVLTTSALGITREDCDLFNQLSLHGIEMMKEVKDSYQLLTAKKSPVTYKANRMTILLRNRKNDQVNVVFQVSNDGVAFRYDFVKPSTDVKKIKTEHTSFHFPEGTKAWLQPKTEAQSGWEHSNPSYEAHYQMDIPAGTASPGPNGWVYPALFKVNDTWLLLTEAALGRNYCGTALQQYSGNNEYKVNFPQEPERFTNGALYPESQLPWKTPWRIITIGSLKTIAESTLGTDLALPAIAMEKDFIKPGRASWSWIMSKDDYIVYKEQVKYIDFAADMGWEYCLVDAAWDKKIGYDSIQLLADYAAKKKVGLLLWYNSAGKWNTVKYTPKDILTGRGARVREFARIQRMGIKGIKVDFFAGDGQSMINYYQDILEDAAKYKLLVNFHGATLPRGWQRTYPNLMTTEAIYGYEMITFNQEDADKAPAHMVMSAFARNAFDPMDFTPVNLYKVPGKQRRTTTSFEMATGVIFLSGIQHFAESPEGMAQMPAEVKQFMKELPVHWDDLKFIDGYPGKFYVVARKRGNRWYIAGINAETTDKAITLDLSVYGDAIAKSTLYVQDDKQFVRAVPQSPKLKQQSVLMKPNDGFVMVLESKQH